MLIIIAVCILIVPAMSKGKIQDGLCTVFLDQGDGFLFMVEMQKNEKRDGVVLQFHNNGEVEKMAWYVQGVLHGTYRSFWSNGHKKSVLDYQQGVLNGRAHRFNQNGDPQFQLSYVDGRLGGTGYYYQKGSEPYIVEYYNGRAVEVE